MTFADPWYLIILLFIPIMGWWYRRYGYQKEGVIKISSKKLITNAFLSNGRVRYLILKIFSTVVLILLIIGLARPQKIDSLEKSKVEVVDIVLVLDISSSMLAEDFQPNRLEAVKNTAGQFIKNRKGDRIALLVFAGETFIQCPLTVDSDVLQKLLSEVTVAEKEYDGTAIGMAIVNAVNRLRGSTANSKVMVLLSDGSNNAGELDPLTAADIASEFEIKIYTIGAGTNQSTTHIPQRGYVKSEVDEETLREIAKRTKGEYFRATNEKSLSEIYSQIDKMEKTDIEIREYTRYQELYGFFIIPAMFLGLLHEILEWFIFKRNY